MRGCSSIARQTVRLRQATGEAVECGGAIYGSTTSSGTRARSDLLAGEEEGAGDHPRRSRTPHRVRPQPRRPGAVGGPRAPKPRVGRRPTYGADVLGPLKLLGMVLEASCAKRLVAVHPSTLVTLERHGELRVAPEVRAKLLSLSAAAADRLLARERRTLTLKPRGHAKPGTLLKHQIPIRTFYRVGPRPAGVPGDRPRLPRRRPRRGGLDPHPLRHRRRERPDRDPRLPEHNPAPRLFRAPRPAGAAPLPHPRS